MSANCLKIHTERGNTYTVPWGAGSGAGAAAVKPSRPATTMERETRMSFVGIRPGHLSILEEERGCSGV